jgi:hypothetical protein
MAKKIALVILTHENRPALEDMINNVKHFCPNADVLLYNSGDDPKLSDGLDVIPITPSQQLYYARIMPFFLDLFNWLEKKGLPYDYVVNLDNDVLFIRHGFETFLENYMNDCDYLVQWFQKYTPKTSKWRPIRSLRPELSSWYHFFGFEYTHRGFNPGQTFSKVYIEKLITHPKYTQMLELISKNKSYTLHEVLFPTLTDFLKLEGKSYPEQLKSIIRWRPYQAVSGVNAALLTDNAYFIHPVKLEIDDPARRLVRSLITI